MQALVVAAFILTLTCVGSTLMATPRTEQYQRRLVYTFVSMLLLSFFVIVQQMTGA